MSDIQQVGILLTILMIVNKLAVNESFDMSSNTYYQCVRGSGSVSDVSADTLYEALFSSEKVRSSPL